MAPGEEIGGRLIDKADGWKKISATVLGVALLLVKANTGLVIPAEVTQLIMAYIAAQGIADFGKRKQS